MVFFQLFICIWCLMAASIATHESTPLLGQLDEISPSSSVHSDDALWDISSSSSSSSMEYNQHPLKAERAAPTAIRRLERQTPLIRSNDFMRLGKRAFTSFAEFPLSSADIYYLETVPVQVYDKKTDEESYPVAPQDVRGDFMRFGRSMPAHETNSNWQGIFLRFPRPNNDFMRLGKRVIRFSMSPPATFPYLRQWMYVDQGNRKHLST